MKYRFIPAFVMLLAGLVCCIMSIIQRWNVTYSLIALILVLIVFYLIGQIAAQIVGKVVAEHEAIVKAELEEKRRLEEEKRNAEIKAKEEAEKLGGQSENNPLGDDKSDKH